MATTACTSPRSPRAVPMALDRRRRCSADALASRCPTTRYVGDIATTSRCVGTGPVSRYRPPTTAAVRPGPVLWEESPGVQRPCGRIVRHDVEGRRGRDPPSRCWRWRRGPCCVPRAGRHRDAAFGGVPGRRPLRRRATGPVRGGQRPVRRRRASTGGSGPSRCSSSRPPPGRSFARPCVPARLPGRRTPDQAARCTRGSCSRASGFAIRLDGPLATSPPELLAGTPAWRSAPARSGRPDDATPSGPDPDVARPDRWCCPTEPAGSSPPDRGPGGYRAPTPAEPPARRPGSPRSDPSRPVDVPRPDRWRCRW